MSDAAMPRVEWPLSREGRVAARRLGMSIALLGGVGVVATSAELKARQTADELGLGPPTVVPGLSEVARPWADKGYHDQCRAYLGGEELAGWEPRGEVVTRFETALRTLPEKPPSVVISHGLAITLWVARLTPGLNPVDFWEGLTFPDAWLLEPLSRI